MDKSRLAEEILRNTSALLRSGLKKKTNSFVHGEMFILNYLYDRSEGARPSELSSAMHAGSARVAMMLKSLEAKGFIARRPDEKDRRRVIVTITPLAAEEVSTERGKVRKKIQRVIDAIGLEETQDFLRILKKMLDVIAEMEAAAQEET
ncbi:MAG TPA: winged helix-turn-helix transcriptional regulator [Papillibacter sp.]|jgi:DNA-binding MarR family transcriptional regulator|nr:winged helix-turn-helix transcriptional regulator [Papillibacter sp.]